MLFIDDRKHFFRPLTGKYRAQVVECLRELYARLYSSMADYSRQLNREQMLEIFQEAIVRAPMMDEGEEEEFSAPVRSEREQANWILNQVLEYGWLERLVDEATLQSSYAFTRVGRLFTQPMVETAGGRFRTRHRNTRNTRNALQSFIEKGEVYDLLDAYEYSERIISDFSDVIAELDERKRMLVQEVEAQQVVQRASDEFFDFMEKRFMPDIAIRLSADSVEKYRDEIQGLVRKARRKQKVFKTIAEKELRKLAPELIQIHEESLYLKILDGIESRMHSASNIMLPALRHALNSFTRRADIIIRQLSYSGRHQGQLLAACKELRSLAPAQQNERLSNAADSMGVLDLKIPDPDSLRLHSSRRRREVNNTLESNAEMDRESRRRLFIQQAVELAFSINDQKMRDYVVDALDKGHRIHSQNLPVRNARELLLSGHAVELGSGMKGAGEFYFKVEPTGQQVRTDYYQQMDEFIIELQEQE